MIRTLLILVKIPCALYLRSCDFEEFESVPRSGVICIVICDVCLPVGRSKVTEIKTKFLSLLDD